MKFIAKIFEIIFYIISSLLFITIIMGQISSVDLYKTVCYTHYKHLLEKSLLEGVKK